MKGMATKVGQALSPATPNIAALALLLLLSACSTAPPRAASLGEAYVGPTDLKIRADIPMESPVVATVHHGDRLEILQQRRTVFLRVRTPTGAEGWTDARQLLGARDMAGLRDLAARAARMPSQGVATTYGVLPVHTGPSADAPTFLSIKDGEKFDVLAHLVVPRVSTPRPSLVPTMPKQPKLQPRKTSKASTKVPPPPMPKPPGPPPNWQALSQSGETGNPPPAEPAAKPIPTDDWSLIRTAAGQSGWVLTRRMWMAIPDAVAQYAEGHRIVSYFPIGEVRDGDDTEKVWLWTTIDGSANSDYDFDSFRVFVWSLRHHRYETAYIERNLKGHSPVLLKQGAPGFSICEEKADGRRHRRDYAFLNPSVRFTGEAECDPQPPLQPAESPSVAPAPAPPKAGSVAQRVKRWFSK